MVDSLNLRYRFCQFWQDIWATTDDQIIAGLRNRFEARFVELFSKLSAGEQAHSLRVLGWLDTQGETNQDLLIAALLHDVGKSRFRLSIWDRAWVVITNGFFPSWQKSFNGYQMEVIPKWKIWLKPLIIAENHPHWGAEMVAQAGGSAMVVELIREHQNHLADPGVSLKDQLLYKLQYADRNN